MKVIGKTGDVTAWRCGEGGNGRVSRWLVAGVPEGVAAKL